MTKEEKTIELIQVADISTIKTAALIETLSLDRQIHGIAAILQCDDMTHKLIVAGAYLERPHIAIMPLEKLKDQILSNLEKKISYRNLSLKG